MLYDLKCNAYGQSTSKRTNASFFQRKSEKSDTLTHNLAGSHLLISTFRSRFCSFSAVFFSSKYQIVSLCL